MSTEILQPAFSNNNIPVVFSSDNNYAPYLGVTIKSLIENSTTQYNYDIVILTKNINERNKKLIKKMEQKNISIRFYDVSSITKNFEHLFYTWGRFSPETYYRLFSDIIFRNYTKILYIDVDTIILDNIAKLYNTDISNYYLAAARNYSSFKITMNNGLWNKRRFRDYLMTELKLKNPYNNFQAGVILINIEQMIKIKLHHQAINLLQQIPNPILVDQDILNTICQDHVLFISPQWNYEWVNQLNIDTFVFPEFLEEAINALQKLLIIHYNGKEKVWASPLKELAHYWWHYARMTPYYEEIIYRNFKPESPPTITKIVENSFDYENIRHCFSLAKYKRKYLLYKIFSKLIFMKREKYINRANTLKKQIKQTKSFLKYGK